MNINRISTVLIVLVTTLLVISSGLSYSLYAKNKSVVKDAEIINLSGIVRGSIQRLSKLSLSSCNQECLYIQGNIDRILDEIIINKDSGKLSSLDKNFYAKLSSLKTEWKNLKSLLFNYNNNPSDELLRLIILSSEQCWQIADSAVLFAQLSLQDRITKTSFLFYFSLSLNVLNFIFIISLIFTHVRKRLEFDAAHDPLTGLFNRKSYETYFQQEIARCDRYNRIFSLLLVDIDNLKKVNDLKGHRAGDELIRNVTKLVNNILRKSDKFFRIGGDEFAIILPETNRFQAKKLARKFLNDINSSQSNPDTITISIGIADYRKNSNYHDVFDCADKALYIAKMSGKNRIEIFHAEQEETNTNIIQF